MSQGKMSQGNIPQGTVIGKAGPVRTVWLAALAALALPAMAQAQATSCRMPSDFSMPRPDRRGEEQVRRLPITRYLLTVSWSPEHCHANGGERDSQLQCSGQAGRFGFVLHGLWPESSGREWPQYCRPSQPLNRSVIRNQLCTTPSPQLIQHEWDRHGNCTNLSPERFFALGRQLYGNLRFPDMAALAARRDLTVADMRRALTAANPRIPGPAFAIITNQRGWLDEVRICLNRRYRAEACPTFSRGANDGSALRIAAPD